MHTPVCRLLAIVAFALPAAATGPPARAAEWTVLETPHFRVLSEVPESRSREIIRRLDIFMKALPTLTNLPVKPAPGVTEVFLLESREFARVEAGRGDISGFFMQRPFHNRIVVDASRDLRTSLETVQHEYVHFAIRNANLGDLPAFYEEGLAQILESFTLNGQRFEWGSYPRGYEVTARSKFMPLPQLLGIRTSSPEYVDEDRQTSFYARSLLFMHYCMRGEPAFRGPLEKLAARLADGDSVEDAFDAEFGMSPEAMDKALDDYLARRAANLFMKSPRSEFDRDPHIVVRTPEPGAEELAYADLLSEAAPDDTGLIPLLESLTRGNEVADRAAAALAAAYDRAGRHADADAQVDRVARFPAASAEALAATGGALFERAQDDDLTPAARTNLLRRAASFYDAALEKQPESLEAIYGRGLVEVYLQDDLMRTARMVLDAYPRSGNSADLAVLLAAHFSALGDTEAADRARRAAACGAIAPATRRSLEGKIGAVRCFAAK